MLNVGKWSANVEGSYSLAHNTGWANSGSSVLHFSTFINFKQLLRGSQRSRVTAILVFTFHEGQMLMCKSCTIMYDFCWVEIGLPEQALEYLPMG